MNPKKVKVTCPVCVGLDEGAGCASCAAGEVTAWKAGQIMEAQRILALPDTQPDLTVLNYSGGTGSTAILWMVLLGEIPRPKNLLVLNADPGMEDSRTYAHVAQMAARCAEAGIDFQTVEGPDLHADLLDAAAGGRSRVDNPPYWVQKPSGSVGQLVQKCTMHYKIAPMDKAIRRWMHINMGINPRAGMGLRAGMVEKWVGMTADEMHRVTEPKTRYQIFRYPLIERGIAKTDLAAWYAARDVEKPPRSVCVGCFANGHAYFTQMAKERPEDFARAVALDDAIRDMGPQINVNEGPIYISRTMRPLRELAESGPAEAGDGENPDMGCQTGYCFY